MSREESKSKISKCEGVISHRELEEGPTTPSVIIYSENGSALRSCSNVVYLNKSSTLGCVCTFGYYYVYVELYYFNGSLECATKINKLSAY